MANLLTRLRGGERSLSIDEYIAMVNQYAYGYTSGGVEQTIGGQTTERAPNNFIGLAQHAFAGNGVVFACMLVRQLVFSSIRFRYQLISDGKPSKSFGASALSLLETPWIGGTTQDLLSRMIQDADLSGNSYWIREGDELVRLRPDWIDIVVQPRMMRDGRGQIGWKKAGYIYTTGGDGGGHEPVGLLPDEVVHFAPIPDPLASFRGMSWLTPIIREIQADESMTRHRRKFFDNGATPNMIVKHDVSASEEKVTRFAQMMKEKHGGIDNAYKTLHLYPGADATVVGRDFRQVDFKGVQGAGETRIAAAAGVPPVIVGLSEGLAAATYSNYGQARRRLADGTAHPLWQNAAGSMGLIMPSQGPGTRLWYDASDVPFLREDEKDAADIAFLRAQTIRQLVEAGYTPESVIQAVESGDYRLLVHSGFLSVQLQKPGADPNPAPAPAPASDPPPQN